MHFTAFSGGKKYPSFVTIDRQLDIEMALQPSLWYYLLHGRMVRHKTVILAMVDRKARVGVYLRANAGVAAKKIVPMP